jgi:dihydroorotase-like cyclic amidohydrolase
VTRYALFARKAKCPRLYVVHLAAGEALEAARAARLAGTNVVVETCPQYLTMTKSDAAGVLLKVNPPIRDRMNNEALWQGVADGHIDCLGTDHVVTSRNEKLERGDTAGRDEDPHTNVWATGSGFPGVQYSLALMLSEGVRKGRITLEKLVEIACANTAYQWGLYPKKGAIQVGSDADLVILDLDKRVKVQGADALSRADFSIYEGMELQGWPAVTIAGGDVVYEDAQVVAERGRGRYLPRLPNSIVHPPDMDWVPAAQAEQKIISTA